MDLSEFYRSAEAGERPNPQEILEYIRSFEHIILWGAADLGEMIGKYLISQNIYFDCYWDLRAEELKALNGKDVRLPFDSTFDKDKTLIIQTIANNVLQRPLRHQLRKAEYKNVIFGIHLYMALLCPSSIACGLDAYYCLHKSVCLKIFCPRQVNLFSLAHRNSDTQYPLNLNSVTLIVNQKCNLSCKYCSSYMHSYTAETRVNFPVKNIVRDIHHFFAAIDSASSVTVMGGEPFLHPDISMIVQALLEHDNFGFISIATNGVCDIKPQQLDGLNDPRVMVSVNNYLPSLPKKMGEMFNKNVKLLTEMNIFHVVGNYMKEWAIPSTLYPNHVSTNVKIRRKNECTTVTSHIRCHQLKDGKLYPCDFANAVHHLRVADYPQDYVDITSNTDLRKRLYENIHAPYYESCDHCRFGLGSTKGAAVQGRLDYITLPENIPFDQYIPGENI